MFTIQQKKFETPMLKFLQTQGVDLTKKEHTAYTFQCCEKRSSHSSHTCEHGMMDLVVETFYEGKILKVSVCHYGEQNGDLMTDPEIVYRANTETGMELPEYYKNNYMGIEQFVFSTDNGKEMYKPKLLKDLQKFTKTWVRNLKTAKMTLLEVNS